MNNNKSTQVITGENTRFSYLNVFEPKSINGGAPKYSVSLIIPKSDKKTIDSLWAAIKTAYTEGSEKLKNSNGTVPPFESIHCPIRDGDLERPGDPAYADSFFLNANSKNPPLIVDKNNHEFFDPSQVYSGMYGLANISFYPYSVSGNRGIACSLNALKILRDGEPLGYRKPKAEDYFTEEYEEFFV